MTWIEYGGSLEDILELLNKYTLKSYSSIDLKPTWLSKEAQEEFKGCFTICGNFLERSNAFYIISDEQNVLEMFRPHFKGMIYDYYDTKARRFA